MAKNNTDKKLINEDYGVINPLDTSRGSTFNSSKKSKKLTAKEVFETMINKNKNKELSKGEYLKNTFDLRKDQFSHKKSMDLKNFNLKESNMKSGLDFEKYKFKEQMNLRKYAIDKKYAIENRKIDVGISSKQDAAIQKKKEIKKNFISKLSNSWFGGGWRF